MVLIQIVIIYYVSWTNATLSHWTRIDNVIMFLKYINLQQQKFVKLTSTNDNKQRDWLFNIKRNQ